MKRTIALCSVIAALTVAPSAVFSQTADVPKAISYSGHLTDSGGLDLNATVSVEVRLYDSLIAGIGQGVTNAHVLYAESHPAMAVEGGNFSVAIGGGASLDAKWTELPVEDLVSKDAVYLELWVNGERLSPRQQMGSVPAAVRAGRAKYADQVVNIENFIDASSMPAYSANKITAGTFNVDRIPYLNASKVNTVLSQSQLPASIDVSKFNQTVAFADDSLFPDLAAATYLTSGILSSNVIPAADTYFTGDVVFKVGTLIHGQHLDPPQGFDISQCAYIMSPVETSGAVEGIDQQITFLQPDGILFCRVQGGYDDSMYSGITCNAHYMMACKKED